MRISGYKDIDREQWGALVQSSETGTWFQGPEAFEFYASMPELFRPFAIGIVRDAEHLDAARLESSTLEMRAVCVGYVTVEKSAIRQMMTRRAIIIGGPCLADDCTEEEVVLLMIGVKELMNERINGAPIYIETRNFNDYSRWKNAFAAAGFEYKAHLNYHVDCRDKGAMWERLSENRCRQVRKAQATVECLTSEGVSELEIREWYEVLAELYRTKVKTPLWPVEFFLEAYRQGIGRFLLVKYGGKVIGGSMVVVLKSEGVSELENEGCVYEWFECGLNAEYKEQYPSVVATYAGIQLAHKLGCQRYDMMGAGEPGVPYGVRDFKSEFGGKLVEHGRFLCVKKPLLYRMGVFIVKILKRKL